MIVAILVAVYIVFHIDSFMDSINKIAIPVPESVLQHLKIKAF